MRLTLSEIVGNEGAIGKAQRSNIARQRDPLHSTARGEEFSRLRAGAFRIFLSNWMALLLRAATTVLIIRTAGVDAKGIQTYAVAWAGVASVVAGAGWPASLSFWINSKGMSVKVLRKRLLFHTAIVTSALLLFSPFLLRIIPSLDSPLMTDFAVNCWMLALTPLLLINDLMSNLALAQGKVKAYGLQVNGEAIAFSVALVGFWAFTGLTPRTVMISSFAGYAFATWLGWFKLSGWDVEQNDPSVIPIGEMYKFSLKSYPGVFITGIQRRLDILIVGPVLGATQLAYYAIGSQGYQVLMSVPRAMTGLLTRSLCKANCEDATGLAMLVTRRVALYISLLAAALSLVGFWAIPIVYGPAFTAAIPAFIMLVWAAVFSGASSCLQSLCMGRGKPEAASLNLFVTAGLKIAFLIFLVRPMGILGCAVATLLSAMLGFLLQHLQVRNGTEPPQQRVS